jgi:hypothetical protein
MSTLNIPWPGDKDRVFEEVTPWEPPPHWMDIFSRDKYLPNVYKESADMIIDRIEKGEVQGNTSIFISPIAYLYRHSFELSLKKLIYQGIALEILEQNDKLKEILGDHKLCPLWNKVRIVLENVWLDGDKKDLANVERVIQQFHTVDESGQVFRYAADKNGNPIDKHSITVDFSAMKKCCDNLFSFFEACEMGLDNAIDNLNDMRSEYF